MERHSKYFALIGLLVLSLPWPAFAQLSSIKSSEHFGDVIGSFIAADDALKTQDEFGASVISVGDIDGNGVEDLVVGAPGDDAVKMDGGAIWLLLLDDDDQVVTKHRVTPQNGLENNTRFGAGLTLIAGPTDGKIVLAVGAPGAESNHGAIWLIELDTAGGVSFENKVSSGLAKNQESLVLDGGGEWGSAVANIGDVDGNGHDDLAVGARANGKFTPRRLMAYGGLWVLFMQDEKTVALDEEELNSVKIADGQGGFPDSLLMDFDHFGASIARLDPKTDTTTTIVVGSPGRGQGAIWEIDLDATGNVIAFQEFGRPNEPPVAGQNEAEFGSAVVSLGPLTGETAPRLAVGAAGEEAVWLLKMTDTPESSKFQYQPHPEYDVDGVARFGHALTATGSVSGGNQQLVVGLPADDDSPDGSSGSNFGALWHLSLPDITDDFNLIQKISNQEGELVGLLDREGAFGHALAQWTDGEGRSFLFVGTPNADEGRGEIHILELNGDNEPTYRRSITSADPLFGQIPPQPGNRFGASLALIEDDNDIDELVVGAPGTGESGEGALWVLTMGDDATIAAARPIVPAETQSFGSSLASLTRLGAGRSYDLAVGAPTESGGGMIWLVTLNPDTISPPREGNTLVPTVIESELAGFGHALAFAGSFSSTPRLAVGAPDAFDNRGTVWMIDMDSDGALDGNEGDGYQLNVSNVPADARLGASLSSLTTTFRPRSYLAIGAPGTQASRGAIWLARLNNAGRTDHTVSLPAQNLPNQRAGDQFGSAITSLGDLDDDGVLDLAVGAVDALGQNGGVWSLFLDAESVIDINGNASIVDLNQLQDHPITACIEEASDSLTVTLQVRRGGEGKDRYVPFNMDEVEDEACRRLSDRARAYKAHIPAGFISPRGIDYFVTAIDDQNPDKDKREPSGENFATINVTISGDGLPYTLPEDRVGRYSLISIPIELDSTSATAVLEDDLGTYDNTQWRFFEPLPQTESTAFPEYPNTNNFESGKAFWLIVKDRTQLLLDTGSGKSLLNNVLVTLQLQPGWNYIGNPFFFPLPWCEPNVTMEGNAALPRLHRYSGSTWPMVQHGESLAPFEGFALEHNDSTGTILTINPDLSSCSEPALSQAKKLATVDRDWTLQLDAYAGEYADIGNQLGMRRGSLVGWDPSDGAEPPSIGSYVSLSFPHPDWDKPLSHYHSDFRPPEVAKEIWDVEVHSNIRDKIQLRVPSIETVPAQYAVWLIDSVAAYRQNLRVNPIYEMAGPINTKPRSLQILVSLDPDFVETEDNGLPDTFALNPNFPNPFTQATTLPFDLPQNATVSITVYNTLGQEVTRLLEADERPAGRHVVVWDGRDHAGAPLASGVYFARFQADGYTQTRSLILVH